MSEKQMTIGIPKEPYGYQLRVSVAPNNIERLLKLGYKVLVQHNAGIKADFYDEQYEEQGAQIVNEACAWGADVVVCMNTPPDEQLAQIKRGGLLITRVNPRANPQLLDKFSNMGITVLALDCVPRISRAQSLDVLSSMMNIAGYKAVIEAADAFGRLFPGQVTAAGKMPPARVYVIGAGVAGLSAIGTASSMGAVVAATDVRPEVFDQVESLGGEFIEIPVKQESTDGYAKEMSEDEQSIAQRLYAEQAAKSDIIITTAQIPGRPSPLLLTEEAVLAMKPGSVIVDMGASEQGSNTALTKVDQVVTTPNRVTIIGYTNLANRLPMQASQMFGQNVVNLFKLITPNKDGCVQLNEEDEVVRGMMLTREGKTMWPPPPVSVSAASGIQKAQMQTNAAAKEEVVPTPRWKKLWWKILLGVLAVLLIAVAPANMANHFIVFMLAVVVGFYVITAVTHSLHTPLMSVTNAISGIIIVGAILLAGTGNIVVTVLAFIAMVIASINIFGGFLVSHRMLKMFQRSSDK
ncbi:Re/Si-specific NAD(P)(+) transhydrogenase subunit alpha [Adlercreutzia sp. ZJ154]|uniref:Re/Si-specific NAD(P)(+) transhydrogenase subunit alpha n=1 Tax=Adlercreutzia sp. ZJ154 TaxID=2709790 RepID=UPI001F1539EF|nr:Re/Si-specific NAD(P)(+) transhydrogenase subunit alpha [Adlercreutzia sp. ZJ154]